MSKDTIGGIFMPFPKYIKNQLQIRRNILSNTSGKRVGHKSMEHYLEKTDHRDSFLEYIETYNNLNLDVIKYYKTLSNKKKNIR